MKHCGDNEERAEPHAIDPCCYFFPSIIRKSVEKGTAHNCRNNEECVCVTVSSMFVASGFVAAVSWSWVVHEPPEPLLEPPHGSEPPAPAGRWAGGRDGRLRAAPEAARAGVRALIGVRAAAARSDGQNRPSAMSESRAGGRPL